MKKYLFICICLISCFSCALRRGEVSRKSTIKLEGKNTSIRDIIEIDGHYPLSSDTSHGSIMFFHDGSWVYFHFKLNVSQEEIAEDLSGSIKSWIDKGQVRWGFSWGVYEIKSDTIIVHSYTEPGFLVAWTLSENRYKVIDRQTIKEIYFKIKNEDKNEGMRSQWINGDFLRFSSSNSLPSSDTWLKENKWIWRNESDWREYMKHVEQVKKGSKKE